jgi:hypothetical protein
MVAARVSGRREAALVRNGSDDAPDSAEISVICTGCDGAVRVDLTTYVDGGTAECPECEATLDLDELRDGLVAGETLLERIPAEARARLGPVLSEFPSAS